MTDEDERALERRAGEGDDEALRRLLELRERSGRFVWVLRYGEDSVGLDGAVVGVFTSYWKAVECVATEPGFHPGRKKSYDSPKDAGLPTRWTDGYRNLEVQEIELDKKRF